MRLGDNTIVEPVGIIAQQTPGISVTQAGETATKSAVTIAVGSIAVFYLIYRFLIK